MILEADFIRSAAGGPGELRASCFQSVPEDLGPSIASGGIVQRVEKKQCPSSKVIGQKKFPLI